MTTMLLEWVCTSVFLILTVLALRALFGRRVSARLRYVLWAVVLVRLLVPVQLFTSPIAGTWVFSETRVEQNVPDVPSVPTLPDKSAGDSALGLPATGVASGNVSAFPEAPALPDAPKPPAAPDLTKLPAYLGWAWLGGSAVMALVLAASNLRFARKLRRCRIPLEGTDCPLPVYAAVGLPSPCLFGLVRPAVYVTPEAAADPAMLRHVLAHEYTHFRHFDHLWSFLRCAALAVHWWNPLVWLAVTLSRRDGELACDEGALKRLGDGERLAYGSTLLALVTAKPGPGDLLCFATTMAGEKRSLKERVSRIACAPKRWLWAMVAVVLVTALACLCAFGSAEEPDQPDSLWPYDVSALVYIRDAGGFGGDFSIQLNKDGSFTYCAGLLSSYIGVGAWTQDGDVICLADEGLKDSVGIQYYYFRQDDGALVFLAEDSAQFMYVDVADGDRFSREVTESEQQADLNRNGIPETIRVIGQTEKVTMEVWEDGKLLYEEEGHFSHAGWNAVFLCTLDGEDYLLRYVPYSQQGFCEYHYELFTLSADGEEQVVQENRIEYCINLNSMVAFNAPITAGSFDPEKIAAFMDEINGLLANSVQLINTDIDLLSTFQEEGRLYDSLWWLHWFAQRNGGGTMLEQLQAYQATGGDAGPEVYPIVDGKVDTLTAVWLRYGNKGVEFEGEWDYNFQPAEHVEPKVVDLNGDGRDEIVVILIGGHGTGVDVQTPYVFDAETLEQYDTSTLTQDIIAQIECTGDKDNFYLSGPGMERVTIPKSTFRESPRLADTIDLGNIVYYSLINGQLHCTLGCDASGIALTYCGDLWLPLSFEGDDGFRVTGCEYMLNYEYIPDREAFRQVLLGEKGFTLYKNEPPILLNDALKLFDKYDEYMSYWEFTMLDMDGNGYYEVLLEACGVAGDMGGYLLLSTWGDGEIHGTVFNARNDWSNRWFNELKTDGTFKCYDAMGTEWESISSLLFTAGGGTAKNDLAVARSSNHEEYDSFEVNRQTATREEYEAVLAAQDAKQNIWWMSFGPENVHEVFG